MKNAPISPDERLRLCTFAIGDEILAIDIMRIKEIVRPLSVTPVPKAPLAMAGVTDLRGQVLPVFDLRLRFEVPIDHAGDSPHTRFLIVTVDGRLLGLVVDEVFEVVEVTRRDLQIGSGILAGAAQNFFVGVFPTRGRLALLLNIRRLFDGDEKIAFAHADALKRVASTKLGIDAPDKKKPGASQ